jgi:hypothetical protein
MKAWDWIKKVNKINLAEVFLPGYVLNKWVFRVGIALIFFWLLLAGNSLGWQWGDSVYIHCSGENLCENPFFDPMGLNPTCLKYGICDRETLFGGESFGSPPSFFVTHAKDFAGLMVVLMIGLNYLLFNKGFFREPLKKLGEEDLK